MRSTTEIKIWGFHLDMYRHVNNARYLEFMEEARWKMIDESKAGFSFFTGRNLSFMVVNININYRAAAGFGDILVIETALAKTGNRSITVNQTMTLKGKETIAADATVTFVLVDNATGKAVEIDDEIKSGFLA